MRRIREVLRLRYGVGLHQEQIARSCSIGQATVHRYLERAATVGLKWPLSEELDDRQLDQLLFPGPAFPAGCAPTSRGGLPASSPTAANP